MHPEKIWIMLIILVVILVFSNLAMFAIARGFKDVHIDFGKNFRDFTKPWQKEDDGLSELSQRVKDLKKDE